MSVDSDLRRLREISDDLKALREWHEGVEDPQSAIVRTFALVFESIHLTTRLLESIGKRAFEPPLGKL